MKKHSLLMALVCLTFLFYNFSVSNLRSNSKDIASLKDAFKKDFGIGTALNTAQIEEKDPAETAFIARQFNMATPENIMKSAILQPKWGEYNFDLADKIIGTNNVTTCLMILMAL